MGFFNNITQSVKALAKSLFRSTTNNNNNQPNSVPPAPVPTIPAIPANNILIPAPVDGFLPSVEINTSPFPNVNISTLQNNKKQEEDENKEKDLSSDTSKDKRGDKDDPEPDFGLPVSEGYSPFPIKV